MSQLLTSDGCRTFVQLLVSWRSSAGKTPRPQFRTSGQRATLWGPRHAPHADHRPGQRRQGGRRPRAPARGARATTRCWSCRRRPTPRTTPASSPARGSCSGPRSRRSRVLMRDIARAAGMRTRPLGRLARAQVVRAAIARRRVAARCRLGRAARASPRRSGTCSRSCSARWPRRGASPRPSAPWRAGRAGRTRRAGRAVLGLPPPAWRRWRPSTPTASPTCALDAAARGVGRPPAVPVRLRRAAADPAGLRRDARPPHRHGGHRRAHVRARPRRAGRQRRDGRAAQAAGARARHRSSRAREHYAPSARGALHHLERGLFEPASRPRPAQRRRAPARGGRRARRGRARRRLGARAPARRHGAGGHRGARARRPRRASSSPRSSTATASRSPASAAPRSRRPASAPGCSPSPAPRCGTAQDVVTWLARRASCARTAGWGWRPADGLRGTAERRRAARRPPTSATTRGGRASRVGASPRRAAACRRAPRSCAPRPARRFAVAVADEAAHRRRDGAASAADGSAGAGPREARRALHAGGRARALRRRSWPRCSRRGRGDLDRAARAPADVLSTEAEADARAARELRARGRGSSRASRRSTPRSSGADGALDALGAIEVRDSGAGARARPASCSPTRWTIRARRFRAVLRVRPAGGRAAAAPAARSRSWTTATARALAIASGLVLPRHEDTLARERSLFYACVSRPEEALFL